MDRSRENSDGGQEAAVVPPPDVARLLHRGKTSTWPRAELWLGWAPEGFAVAAEAWRGFGAIPIEDPRSLTERTSASHALFVVYDDDDGSWWGVIASISGALAGGRKFELASEAWRGRLVTDGALAVVLFRADLGEVGMSETPPAGTVLQTPEDLLGASAPMLGLCLWATGYEELDRRWRTRLAYKLRRICNRVGRRRGVADQGAGRRA